MPSGLNSRSGIRRGNRRLLLVCANLLLQGMPPWHRFGAVLTGVIGGVDHGCSCHGAPDQLLSPNDSVMLLGVLAKSPVMVRTVLERVVWRNDTILRTVHTSGRDGPNDRSGIAIMPSVLFNPRHSELSSGSFE